MKSILIFSLSFLISLCGACSKQNQAEKVTTVRAPMVEILQNPQVVSTRNSASILSSKLQFDSAGNAMLAWLVDDNAIQAKLIYRFYDRGANAWNADQFVMLPKNMTSFQLVSNTSGFAISPASGDFVGIYNIKTAAWSFLGPFAAIVNSDGPVPAPTPTVTPVQGTFLWPQLGGGKVAQSLKVIQPTLVSDDDYFYFLTQTYHNTFVENEWRGNVVLELNIAGKNSDGEFGVIEKIEINQSNNYLLTTLSLNRSRLSIHWLDQGDIDNSKLYFRDYNLQNQTVSTIQVSPVEEVDEIVNFQVAGNEKFQGVLWVAKKAGKQLYGLQVCELLPEQDCVWQSVSRSDPNPGSSVSILYYELQILQDSFVLLNSQEKSPIKHFILVDSMWQMANIALPPDINITGSAAVYQNNLWVNAVCDDRLRRSVSTNELAGESCPSSHLLHYMLNENGIELQQQHIVDSQQAVLDVLAVNPQTSTAVLAIAEQKTPLASQFVLQTYTGDEPQKEILKQQNTDIVSSENPQIIAVNDTDYLLLWEESRKNGVQTFIRPYRNNQWQESFTIDNYYKQIHHANLPGKVIFTWSDFSNIKALMYNDQGFSETQTLESGLDNVLELAMLADLDKVRLVYAGKLKQSYQINTVETSGQSWSEPQMVEVVTQPIKKILFTENARHSILLWKTSADKEYVSAKLWQQNGWSETKPLFSANFIKDMCIAASDDYFLLQWNDYVPANVTSIEDGLQSYAWVLDGDQVDPKKIMTIGDGDFTLSCHIEKNKLNTLSMIMPHKSRIEKHHYSLADNLWSDAEILYKFDANDAVLSSRVYSSGDAVYVLWQAVNVNNGSNRLYLADVSQRDNIVRYQLASDRGPINKLSASLQFSTDNRINVVWLGADFSDQRNHFVPQVLMLRDVLH